MKKLNIIVIVIVATMLTGCTKAALQNNFPKTLEGAYLKTKNEANVALANSGIKDIAMFDREMQLVAYSAKRHMPSNVTFLYAEDTGKVCPLQTIEFRTDYTNDYEYPELLKSEITLRVLDHLGESQYDNGDIVGVIMNWEQSHVFGDSTFHSVCDFDGDGTWDFCAQDTSWNNSIFYTSLVAAEDSQPSRVFNDYNIVGIHAVGGIKESHDDYL